MATASSNQGSPDLRLITNPDVLAKGAKGPNHLGRQALAALGIMAALVPATFLGSRAVNSEGSISSATQATKVVEKGDTPGEVPNTMLVGKLGPQSGTMEGMAKRQLAAENRPTDGSSVAGRVEEIQALNPEAVAENLQAEDRLIVPPKAPIDVLKPN